MAKKTAGRKNLKSADGSSAGFSRRQFERSSGRCRPSWSRCSTGSARAATGSWSCSRAATPREGRHDQADRRPAEPTLRRVAALPAPTERERTQWYFQRYVAQLPAAGEMVLFDRSWYNRAGVERVMGFCSDAEYWEFLRSVPEFERMLSRSGIQLVKYWFSVSDEEQERRFQARIDDRSRRWKLCVDGSGARRRWVDYSRAKDLMVEHTSIPSRRGTGGCRRETPRAAELHRAPALARPLRRGRAPRGQAASSPGRPGLQAAAEGVAELDPDAVLTSGAAARMPCAQVERGQPG